MRTSGAGLLAVAVLVGIVLLTGAEVTANPAGVPAINPVPLECSTLNFNVKAVTVDDAFPVIVPCEDDSNTGKVCAKYGYEVSSKTTSTRSITKVDLAISVDQDLDITHPAATVFPPGSGDVAVRFLEKAFHEYAVRFETPLGTRFTVANVAIVLPSAPRPSTVLIRPSAGAFEGCLIAGPGVLSNPFQPVPMSQDVKCAAGKCTCHLFFDAAGRIESVTTDPPCATSATDVTVTLDTPTGPKTETATFFEVITSGTGTCTTYPTRPRATTICR